MAYSVAYQHTDSNRNYYGCYELHGVNEKEPLVITTGGLLEVMYNKIKSKTILHRRKLKPLHVTEVLTVRQVLVLRIHADG